MSDFSPRTQSADFTPRIYVASLAAYNAGTLHGVWIDLDGKDADDVQAEIADMLKACPQHGEEYAIHDTDDFGGMSIGEYDGIASVVETARMLVERGGAWAAYVDIVGADYATEFEDAYCGEYDSPEVYAMELADELGYEDKSSEWPYSCIDWEKAWRELSYDGYTFHNGYVFRGV